MVSIECTCVIKKFSHVIVSGESGECSIKDVHGKVLDQIRLCRFSCTLPYSPHPHNLVNLLSQHNVHTPIYGARDTFCKNCAWPPLGSGCDGGYRIASMGQVI